VPSLLGKACVYDHNGKVIYSIDRGFNGLEMRNFLALSNDGRTLLYVIAGSADEKVDGLKSISIYRDGKLIKSFTQQQITGCDPLEERCNLLYFEPPVTKADTTPKDANYTEEKKFLKRSPVIQVNNLIYLVDPKWMVHIFDLNKADTVGTKPLAGVFAQISKAKRDTLTTFQKFQAPYLSVYTQFPNLINGDTTAKALAKAYGLKVGPITAPFITNYQYFQIFIHALIGKDGSIDIKSFSSNLPVSPDTVKKFFQTHRYDLSFLPTEIDKWYFQYFFCRFRDSSDAKAMEEKKIENEKQALVYKHNLVADSINGIYIPDSLQDCFVTLDKVLPNVLKKEMTAMKKSGDMLLYHLSLGMWMRNNWGLWGGSRLLVYFKDHGVKGFHDGFPNAEGVSTLILMEYYDWLHGNKNAAAEWEQKNPVKAP
jgi:hypothetical protein